MKRKLVYLVALSMLVVASPLVVMMASALGSGAVNAQGPPDPVPCTFDNPDSLPGDASGTAQGALDDRSTHCPPTLP